MLSTEPVGLRRAQLAWLAAAVFVVSAGFGALMPLLPAWMTPMRKLLGTGLILAMAGLVVLAQHRSEPWMYLGVSLTAAGTGLVLPVISYQAAGATRHKLGVTMGGLAAAAGLGQRLGSAFGGWLFGALAQRSFGWLTLPLVAVMMLLLVVRPDWWLAIAAEFTHPPTGGSRF